MKSLEIAFVVMVSMVKTAQKQLNRQKPQVIHFLTIEKITSTIANSFNKHLVTKLSACVLSVDVSWSTFFYPFLSQAAHWDHR